MSSLGYYSLTMFSIMEFADFSNESQFSTVQNEFSRAKNVLAAFRCTTCRPTSKCSCSRTSGWRTLLATIGADCSVSRPGCRPCPSSSTVTHWPTPLRRCSMQVQLQSGTLSSTSYRHAMKVLHRVEIHCLNFDFRFCFVLMNHSSPFKLKMSHPRILLSFLP